MKQLLCFIVCASTRVKRSDDDEDDDEYKTREVKSTHMCENVRLILTLNTC